jgi:hypothetical protein
MPSRSTLLIVSLAGFVVLMYISPPDKSLVVEVPVTPVAETLTIVNPESV